MWLKIAYKYLNSNINSIKLIMTFTSLHCLKVGAIVCIEFDLMTVNSVVVSLET